MPNVSPSVLSPAPPRAITPEMVQQKLHELLRARVPRKLIVNVGVGKIQDAHVEVKEHLR